MIYDQRYLDRMKEMLGSEYPAFFASLNEERTYGLRFNALKVADDKLDEIRETLNLNLEPISWEKRGYYYSSDEQPGKHILHDLGAYYIQEPSAQSVVSQLDIHEGELILDLCAAPGGKSTQILSYLNNTGLLISNEIMKDRSLVLASNIERMGAKNSVVLNENPDTLAKHFPLTFDRILIDSPCSGEGMFRKNPEAMSEWSEENVQICIERDDDILNAASTMLKMGGRIVYSTCTFEYGENEGAIERFLESHSDFKCLSMERLYPHKVKGEGHFYAVLVRDGELPDNRKISTGKGVKLKSAKDFPEFSEFITQTFVKDSEIYEQVTNSNLLLLNDNLYLLNPLGPDLKGLHVIRAGLLLGCFKKNRFEPSHTLAMALNQSEVINCFDCDETEILKFLKGETLNTDTSVKGWTLITYKGISAGWSKAAGGVLKNHYPKGLRRY